jgi:hypothetical protein
MITSQAVNFINQILSFLAYGKGSTVKTSNQASLQMRQMVRAEVETSASVVGFPLNFGGLYHLFPDDQNIQKGNHTV